MNKIAFVYDDIFLRHEMPMYHPESMNRLVSIVHTLKNSDIWSRLVQVTPEKAHFSDLETVHSRSYIDTVKSVGKGYLDADTYMSEHTLEAALFAAGAIKTAVRKCHDGEIDGAFCAVRPPGHHAEKDRGMGFCIFNNVAVGARAAQEMGYDKVFIADFDVHHGNASQHMFYDDDTVFYFSTHQYPHYPGTGSALETGMGRGEGFTCNIPLPGGSGDAEIHDAYNVRLPELVRSFSPDIILVSAGYDLHVQDPLAGLSVTDAGIKDLVRGILYAHPDIPVIFTLEGGYNLQVLSTGVLNTVRELIDVDQTS